MVKLKKYNSLKSETSKGIVLVLRNAKSSNMHRCSPC